MTTLLLRRLATFPLLLLAIYASAVLLVMAAPGDGLEISDRELPAEVQAARRIAFNYDQHWVQRYFWTWPRRLLWDGDLPSHRYEDWTVVAILRSALPVSLQLGTLALSLAIAMGVGAGVLAAAFRGRAADHASIGLCLIGISLPTFATGTLLLIVCGLWLKIVPVGGWGEPAQALLPALTLALPYAAYLARLTRAALLDALGEDFIRTARAKGLSPAQVLRRHALPTALLPVLTYLGPAAAAIYTGSFVVEKVFGVPGMGTHVVESINNRDQSLILATVMIYGLLLAGLNLVVDVLYAVIDPRIRVGAAAR